MNISLHSEEKIELLMEYIKETGKNVGRNTHYKGYNLSSFQNHIRQQYFNGTLDIDENLLSQCIEAGIITKEKRNRSSNISDKEKLELMTEYMHQTGKEIKYNTIFKGYHIGLLKSSIRHKYFAGILKMDADILQQFKDIGIISDSKHKKRTSLPSSKKAKKLSPPKTISLKKSTQSPLSLYSQEELKALIKTYNLPKTNVIDIIRNYGSFDNFTKKFKTGEINYDFHGKVFCGHRGITISKREITEEQKLSYITLYKDIWGQDEITNTYQDGWYLDIDIFDSYINQLTDRQKEIIEMSYGLNGEKFATEQIGRQLGISGAYVRAIKKDVVSNKLPAMQFKRFYCNKCEFRVRNYSKCNRNYKYYKSTCYCQ